MISFSTAMAMFNDPDKGAVENTVLVAGENNLQQAMQSPAPLGQAQTIHRHAVVL